jgi:hypothetical protein
VVNAGGGTFAGNIVNGGAISATSGFGLRVTNVANNGGTFDGNIVNTAKISAATGMEIEHVGAALFSGNISNSGAITAMTGAGIVVFSIANVTGRTFAGNILNGGTISSLHSGLLVETFKTFTGGIVNSGTINATSGRGILVRTGAIFGSTNASGGISNRGKIFAGMTGIEVQKVATVMGGIVNSGTIAARTGILLRTARSSARSSTAAPYAP